MIVKLAAIIGAVLAASPGSPRRRKARSPAGLSFYLGDITDPCFASTLAEVKFGPLVR
jgi:hypothetical protein